MCLLWSDDLVIQISYTFINIVNNILITSSRNLTVVGTPTLVAGPSGQALELNGADQYIDLSSNDNGCLGNPGQCELGLSVTFNLKFVTLTENMYIFSNGGDEPDGFGTAMYYRRNRLFLTVSTKTKEWTVETTLIKVNVFFKVDFSWSEQTGLVLYLDNKEVASTKTFVTKTVTVTVMTKFYIGLSITTNIYANIVIDGWEVTEATKETRDLILVESTTQAETTMESTTEMSTTESTTEMETSTLTSTGKTNETLLQTKIGLKFYIFLFKKERKAEVKDVLILKK